MVSPSVKTELSSYFSALISFLPLLSPLIQSPDKTVAHKPWVSGQFRDGHQRGKEFRNSSTNTVQNASSTALSSDFKATQKKKKKTVILRFQKQVRHLEKIKIKHDGCMFIKQNFKISCWCVYVCVNVYMRETDSYCNFNCL